MATKTEHLGLTLYEDNDFADQAVLNENMSILEKALIARSWVFNQLVNGNFADPVNTLGLTTLSAAGTFINRWIYGGSGTVAIVDAGITFAPDSGAYTDLGQHQSNHAAMKGKAYTFAVKTVEYGTIVMNFTYGTANQVMYGNGVYLVHDYETDGSVIIRTYEAITAEWALLCEGTYTAKMLAAYAPMTKTMELLRCGALPVEEGGTGVTTVEEYKEKLGLAKVATSGSYNDLSDKPSVSFDPLDAYPVGALYWSSKSTSPASLFGGTWTQIKDKFILAAGSTYSNGATGGAATVTLTIDQIPSHRHDVKVILPSGESGTSGYGIEKWANGEYGYKASTTNYIGGGGSHNNMPPYIVKYCWERTA